MNLPPKPTYAQLEAELFALRQERATRLADAERVLAWIDDPQRKPAVLAFTEGNERQLAYRFEMALSAAARGPSDADQHDLWVSEQHGSLVAIPGYLDPDTSVYKTWLKANYLPRPPGE